MSKADQFNKRCPKCSGRMLPDGCHGVDMRYKCIACGETQDFLVENGIPTLPKLW